MTLTVRGPRVQLNKYPQLKFSLLKVTTTKRNYCETGVRLGDQYKIQKVQLEYTSI